MPLTKHFSNDLLITVLIFETTFIQNVCLMITTCEVGYFELFNKINQLAENIHCVQKKTPTHIFFHISMNDEWIKTKIAVNIPKDR